MIESTVSDGVCVLRLSAPPANTITFPLLDELRAAIRRANAQDEIRGIILTGRPDHFSAGADVGLFRDIVGPEEAVRTSRIFQDAMQAVEDSAKPVVAAVAGRVMGSALELAMACHYRVCTKVTRFSMPEVTLGINPGAGGTQRLPRLVGADEALKMLLTGEAIGAEHGRASGLVDAISEGGDLLETARAVLRSAPGPRKASACTDKVCDAAANEAVFNRARQRLAGVRPEIIAPRIILEAVEAGLKESFQAGLRKEQEGFAQCMGTPATRNKIYLFFATREASKILSSSGAGGMPTPPLRGHASGDAENMPSERRAGHATPDNGAAPESSGTLASAAAPEIKAAAVIGMGSMGTGIAQALIAGGIRVAALDQDAAALQKGADRIRSSLRGRVERGGLAPDAADAMLGLLTTTTDWRDIAGAPLVIEAVFEDTAVKRGVLAKVEAACGDAAIIASNTSTISLDVLAEGMRRPERLVGMHFFNPAHHMPLVEVIRRDATADGVVAAAMRFVKALRKTPVLVRNREGFLVNRLFIPYLKEAFWLLEEGTDAPEIDSAMLEFGFPMGPLALIDMAGLDILALTDRVLRAAFPSHGPLSEVVERLVERGRLGQKTGAGVYRYEKGDRTPLASDETAQIVAEVRQAAGRTALPAGKDEISRRLVLRMVREAFCVMEEGLAARESDVDVAMVLGTGFPDFRGGAIKYARDLGLGRVRADLDKLASEHGARFSPCPLLRNMEGV